MTASQLAQHHALHHHTPVVALAVAALVLVLLLVLLLQHAGATKFMRVAGNITTELSPRILTFTTFLGGVILLFSGATPAETGRIGWINDVLPLPIVELSAYFASLAGFALILLARGLQRRLDAAYHLTLWVLVGGIIFSLASALDVEQAAFLTVMFMVLLPSRQFFYRRSSLFEERFTRGWYVAIAGVLIATAALTYLAYGQQVVSTHVFWEFGDNAQAPRAARGLMLVVVVILGLSLARLLSPSRSRRAAAPVDRGTVEAIVSASPRANAHLALLGDKEFMFDESHTAFLMMARAGDSRIVMGDPVGSVPSATALVNAFIHDCDREGSSAVFYRVGPQLLYLYLDYGLTAVKLGEVARVPLREFSLDGPQRRNLRRVWRKLVEEGCTFEVVPREEVPSVLPRLRAISNEWLERKRAREKGFSLGRFDDSFVSAGPVGIVRRGGEIIAFGSAWLAGKHAEVEIDLMRYTNDAPPGVMRFLLIEFMRWAGAQGYEDFNLGMVPLSGIRTGTSAPLWNQMVGAIRIGGERYYNFRGLRDFKAWFYPVWEPNYLVSPGGPKRPLIIAQIAALISGGAVGVWRK